MDYQDHIRKAIEYIEENLTDALDNRTLARAAGYSEYHFLRVFREVSGLTPADYIRKRRLTEIACRMAENSRPASAIAFAYGFQSKENFTRAFKREHGILPTEFRAAGNSLKLYGPLKLAPGPFRADGELIELRPFELVTYACDQALPTSFWNQYNAGRWSARLSGGKVVEDYGVSIWNASCNKLDYYIGIRSEEAQGNLAGTIRIPVEGGLYARFRTLDSTHANFVNTIQRTWQYIAGVWLPENGYERTGGAEFETYVETSRTFSEEIYIPLQKSVDSHLK